MSETPPSSNNLTNGQSNGTASIDLGQALNDSLRTDPKKLQAHLLELEREIQIGSTKTKLHCYFLPLDGNGRVRFKPLAEFLRDQIIDYAIPRKTFEDAKKILNETGSGSPMSKLHETARSLFTDLATTGEGGELLLFAMAEAIFGFTQIVCKMSLKTSTNVHYHGSDGVYAEVRADGGLNLYWGESKIHGDAGDAIRNCLDDLSPYLIEEVGTDAKRSNDVLLVNEFANFTDERIINGLKQFLDNDNVSSLQLRHCGLALTAFDCSSYPGEDVETTMDKIEQSIKGEISKWSKLIEKRLEHNKLERFDIHFICVPMPLAEKFREYFLQLLGL